jgi:caa(3)-type oxidase subunit IV
MADTPAEIQKAKKLYLLIGMALFVFTVVTVAVATVPWLDFGEHGFDSKDAIIGLLIATFKATLVASIFMHLNHEKKTIYVVLLISAVMGIVLMFLTGWAFTDPIRYGNTVEGDKFYNPEKTTTSD